MSQPPVGGPPPGWEHKLADRASLPPASGEEKARPPHKHVFAQPHPKMLWREETEGSSGSSQRSPASPPYMRWAKSLHSLLEDAEGVRLFRAFVSGAGALHVDRLNFYFAVQGLRQETEPAKTRQVIFAIYKFVRKSQLAMPEALRSRIKQALRDNTPLERTIFDAMEQEVTRAITESTYIAFLRSDAYVSYVSAALQPLSSPEASPPREMALSSGLATVHEEQELISGAGGGGQGPAVGGQAARLTLDALLATQSRRLHIDKQPHRQRSVYSAHVTYAGYTPASRQDSERASLSSGRADSDVMSLSGGSVDGASIRREPREVRPRQRLPGLDKYAHINREQDSCMVIPRTQRIQSENLRVLPPSEFAPLLIEKLEKVRRDQEAKERLDKRIAEGEAEDGATQALPPQLVAAAIREKLQLDDDNDQDILDQHVSRVWSERTPGGSPPPRRAAPPLQPPCRPRPRRAPSASSADSGLCDSSLHHHHSHSLRRSISKKTVTDFTDSGVSVISGATSGVSVMSGATSGVSVISGATSGASAIVEPRIMAWFTEGAERYDRRGRELSSRGSSVDREERRRDKPRARGSGSKSSSASGGATSGAASGSAPSSEHTVVVVSFLDEAVPYRFKVPASPLTLKLFKEYLPRKGNYRYFFKTECADLDNTVIQEEVSNDGDTLPMFEGKVMARVKSIE